MKMTFDKHFLLYLIKLQLDGTPCPNQILKVQTYLISNQPAVTNHPDYMIENAGDIFYPITAGIERKEHYIAVVSIASDKGVVEAKMSSFSKFNLNAFF